MNSPGKLLISPRLLFILSGGFFLLERVGRLPGDFVFTRNTPRFLPRLQACFLSASC